METDFLTINEVCKYLKLPKSTIYKLSQTGKIPSSKIGKQLRFRRSAVDRCVAEREYQNYKPPKKKELFLPLEDAPKTSRKIKHILVVDDDELVLRAVSRLLNAQGWAVEAVTSGHKALKKVQNANFDLVITDIRMPVMDGIETLKKIRQLNKDLNKPDTQEMLITGYTDSEAEKKAGEAGIAECIYKPFANDEFLYEVRKKLGLFIK